MATVKQFEELTAWQKARTLSKEIYREFKYLRDYSFKDQIQRAAVSIMSNIAEGFERGTKQEFLNYLYIAKGSAGEVRAQLYVALDTGYLNSETFKRLNFLCRDCSILIAGLIRSLKVSKFKGLQHKIVRKEEEDYMVKWYRENRPEEFAKYYDPERKEMAFWKMAKDREKKKDT